MKIIQAKIKLPNSVVTDLLMKLKEGVSDDFSIYSMVTDPQFLALLDNLIDVTDIQVDDLHDEIYGRFATMRNGGTYALQEE